MRWLAPNKATTDRVDKPVCSRNLKVQHIVFKWKGDKHDYQLGYGHIQRLIQCGNLILTFIPRLIGFLVILIVGLIIAALVSRALTLLLRKVGFDRLSDRIGLTRFEQRMGVHMDAAGIRPGRLLVHPTDLPGSSSRCARRTSREQHSQYPGGLPAECVCRHPGALPGYASGNRRG